MISVIYVDDESALLDITKTFLEKTGNFKVETASSAQQALQKLKTTQYDAVVADYQMPEIDGIQFLKIIRKEYPDLPFIIFTGKGREEVVIEAFDNGADFYLQKGGAPKPQFTELVKKIKSAVEHRRAEEQCRLLVKNLNDIIYLVDAGSRVQYVNPVTESIMGYSPKEVIGRLFTDFVYEEDIPPLVMRFGEIQSSGIIKPMEWRLKKKDGTFCWVRSSSRPVIINGRFAGIQGRITDISDEREQRKTPAVGTEIPHPRRIHL